MKTNYVLTDNQMYLLAEIREALDNKSLPFIPSRYAFVEELLELPQFLDFYSTGFNFLSMDWKEYPLGYSYSAKWRYISQPFNWLKMYVSVSAWTWKAAYITATAKTFKDNEFPDLDVLECWICECGEEAADPGMGCIACFTGAYDDEEEESFACEHCGDVHNWEEQCSCQDEGPYGGAFRDMNDFYNHVGIKVRD
jgi:hypothetical protein